ncbi:MAG: 30S ribosomal protein S12 methylthiotransferase RimO [Acidimicrobiia bacterium]|nr:30S ribosomal protein S12 methylthiotransferase RimO [Acidimicrobiia bacterium]
MPRRFWVETLGCPKNQVDSDKLTGSLDAAGLAGAEDPAEADVVVVNTCAFIESARQESIDTVLRLAEERRDGAQLVVTGCMAERYRDELADALPEVDVVAGFGEALVAEQQPSDGAAVPVTLTTAADRAPAFDLLRLARPAATAPWAYLKVAEGCDRACGFCAIPTFRGPQRSRSREELLDEVAALDVREVVLVAQDLAAYGRDQGQGSRQLVPLIAEVAALVDRVRLLYLYPSDLTSELIEAVLATDVPYFDLSLQHVSAPLLRRMRRWGDGERFRQRIDAIRQAEPNAVFRTNFIVGYPGETEADHDELLAFVADVGLDWCGVFPYSLEEGTYAATLGDQVPPELVAERVAEVSELADGLTARRRDRLVAERVTVLVDEPGVARSWREAPEIDGIVEVPAEVPVGALVEVEITASVGTDLVAEPVGAADPWVRTSGLTPAPAVGAVS